jgi:UDP-glucose-4-epimerase GalE
VKILVTGGAGYIGSHMVLRLLQHGHETLVFDNLSTGHQDAVRGPFLRGDLCQREQVFRAVAEFRPDAVMHFAARALVGESIADPRLYFYENLTGALHLLDAMLAHEVAYFIFSSTAATYGNPMSVPIVEDHPQLPINPYGDSKLAIERMLVAYARAYPLRYAILRYFNAAGCLPEEGLGERHEPETHLIPLILHAAKSATPSLKIFGRDYETPDGTCIRDYIHVLDLAEGHIAALNYLAHQTSNLTLNLGTSQGRSVLEVIQATERVTGLRIPYQDSPRREGDPPILVASSERAQRILPWTPAHSDLPTIIESAWKFHQKSSR